MSQESDRFERPERNEPGVENLPPDALLFASMRAVGYSFKTAVADLIDNSISAGASDIRIEMAPGEQAFFFVLDNGTGMDRDALRTAMKLAGRSVFDDRVSSDLGRFGLGLKTASLSQAKSLTVISKHQGAINGANWDIDRIVDSGEWSLKWLSEKDLLTLPGYGELLALGSGTLVLWQKLDLFFNDISDAEKHMVNSLEEVNRHVALVFHRFLSRPKQQVRITLNKHKVTAYDPFLEYETKGVQAQPLETYKVGDTTVSVKPYILPPISKMSPTQRAKALFDDSARESQGFYIYRADRLLAWGSWYRLSPRQETSKLARVKVDTSTELDALWKLGIMKSQVTPPSSLVKALRPLVSRYLERAVEVDRGKSKLIVSQPNAAWIIRANSDSTFDLEINRTNPIVGALYDALDTDNAFKLEALITYLEKNFPAQQIHHHLANDEIYQGAVLSDGDLSEQYSKYEKAFLGLGMSSIDALEVVSGLQPFSSTPAGLAYIQKLRTDLGN